MSTGKKKVKEHKAQCTDFTCGPEGFKGMPEEMSQWMSKCCSGQSDSPDCSAMMQRIAKEMCGSEKKA